MVSKTALIGIVVAIIIVVGAVAAYYAMNPPGPAKKAEFKIGVAVSLTGKFASNGKAIKAAYDFWANNVNARGGIEAADGTRYKVKIIYYDDRSDAETSAKLVEKLITEDKVDVIFGPFSSSLVGPTSAICEKYHVPMLEVAGNARPLFQRGFKYLFTTLRPADELADAYFRLLVKELPTYGKEPPKTVAVIAPDAPFYVSAAQGFKNYAEKYGLEVVHYEIFPVDLTDLTPILQKIKAENPDVICMGSHTVPAMMLMRAAKEIDFNPKAYCFSFGTHIPEFIKELGPDANYVLEYVYTSPGAPYSDYVFSSTADWIKAFQKETGMYPDSTQAAAWAAGIALETAFKKSGVTPPLDDAERAKLRDALASLNIVTASGPVKFSSEGFNVANPMGIDQIQNGKFVCVSPPEWKTGNIVYPVPPWSERG